MAQEVQYLLSESNSELETSIIGEMDHHNGQDIGAILKQQSDEMRELRHLLVAERETSASVSKKVDMLCMQLDKLNNRYARDMADKNKEIENLKRTLEAHNESHGAVADELRFQIRSLRNKLDLAKNSNGGNSNGTMDNNTENVSQKSKAPAILESHHHMLKRQNSADSVTSLNSNPCFSSHVNTTQHGEITWRINGFNKKLKRIGTGQYEDPIRSEPFTTGPSGYRLSAWAYLNGRGKGAERYISVYIRVTAGEYDPVLQWPIKPAYTFCLMSQDPDVGRRLDLTRVRDLAVKHSGIYRPQKDDKTIIVGFDDFVMHEDLEKKHYLLDDSLFLKVSVDISPPS